MLTTKATLNRNTLDFISYIKESFGIVFDSKKGIGSVKGEVTKEKVRSLYEVLPIYFPHNTSFRDICFDISKQPFSGFYQGNPDINCSASYIARYALYTASIIITNPFCDLMIYHIDNSPIEKPEAWIQVAMNQALFLVSIEPWIKEGIITVLPSLRWFEQQFFDKELVKISRKRMENLNELESMSLLVPVFMELMKNFQPEYIESFLHIYINGIVPPSILEAAKKFAENEYTKNPIRYKWDVPTEGNISMTKFGSGNSLESAIFTADLCGAYILFGEERYRREYDLAVEKADNIQDNYLTELSRAFTELDFSFLNAVKLNFVLTLRKDGCFSSLRNFLTEIWNEISSLDFSDRKNLYQMFKDKLKEEYDNYKREWNGIQKTLARNMVEATIAGGIAVLSGQIGFKLAAAGVATFGIKQLLEKYKKRKKQERLPLGIFLALEKRTRKK